MPSAKPSPKKKSPSKKKSPPAPKVNHPDDSLPAALADLLRSRKLAVPTGLASAPPEAYANQPASFVEQLAKRPDPELVLFAEKIANYTARRLERAKSLWESSPLIAELRRRKLKVPPPPKRVVGASVSLRKPLKEWTDAQLIKAANEWAKKGS